MAEVSAAAVKMLRERTGLPMMDCKKALNDSQGDADKADGPQPTAVPGMASDGNGCGHAAEEGQGQDGPVAGETVAGDQRLRDAGEEQERR